MAANILETKHSQLVDQLQALNTKLDSFINGDVNTTINTTNGGTIKSLAGIVNDLYKVRALQKIVDHRLLSDAIADSTLPKGILVRVWGDTSKIVGIYRNTDMGLVKISYVDLYDLAKG